MLIDKKKLWFLTAIPLYVVYCYLSVHFFNGEYHVRDILFLSAFVISTTSIIAWKKMIVVIACLLLTHLGLIGACYFLSQYEEFVFYALYVYCLFCVPSLVLIYLVEDSFRQGAKAAIKQPSRLLLIAFCFSPFVIVLHSFITRKETVSFKFDSIAVYLLIFLVLEIVWFIANCFLKDSIQSDFKVLIVLNVAICFCNCLLYLFFAYRYIQDRVFLAFPSITATILIYVENSEIRVKRVEPK